jgi:hypothetical protein
MSNANLTPEELRAITTDWNKTNERRAFLIQKKVYRRAELSESEEAEYEYLQNLADARQEMFAPLPTIQDEERPV